MNRIFVEFGLVVSLSYVGDLSVGAKGGVGNTNGYILDDGTRSENGTVSCDLTREGLGDGYVTDGSIIMIALDMYTYESTYEWMGDREGGKRV